jgi:pilus assembly protein Flp/PilA
MRASYEEADTMRELWKDEEGLTTVEYALLLALVVVAGIAAWQGLGNTVENTVDSSANTIAGAGS